MLQKQKLVTLCLVGMATATLGAAAWAGIDAQDGIVPRSLIGAPLAPAPSSELSGQTRFQKGSSYELKNDIVLSVLEVRGKGGRKSAPRNPVIRLQQGDEFVVLDSGTDASGNAVVELGIDTGSENGLDAEMSDVIVSLYDLTPGQPQLISTARDGTVPEEAALAELLGDGAPGASDELLPTEVARRGRGGVRVRHRRGHGGMTYCYRNVKNYLMAHCGVKTYLPGAAAIDAPGILPDYGFHRISHNFDGYAKMESCSVCVLSGGTHHCGNHACGDIVVKTPGGKWFGWGTRAAPYLRGRTPVGCFHK